MPVKSHRTAGLQLHYTTKHFSPIQAVNYSKPFLKWMNLNLKKENQLNFINSDDALVAQNSDDLFTLWIGQLIQPAAVTHIAQHFK